MGRSTEREIVGFMPKFGVLWQGSRNRLPTGCYRPVDETREIIMRDRQER